VWLFQLLESEEVGVEEAEVVGVEVVEEVR
jgi:hypothetical protein